MRIYTVHLRRHGLDLERDLALVKEGFCWPALFVPVFWALWHAMWWDAFAYFAVTTGAGYLLNLVPIGGVGHAAVLIGINVVIATVANDRRRWYLAHRGFAFADAVAAPYPEAAERRFLDDHPDLARRMADSLEGAYAS